MSRIRRTPADERFLVVRTSAAGVTRAHAIPAHAHTWHQLVFASAGVMTVKTDQGSWVTPSHWAIWVPAGVLHSIRFAAAADFRTLYFRPLATARLPTHCSVIAVGPFLRALILRTIEAGMLDRRDALQSALNVLLLDGIRTEPTAPLDLPLPGSPPLLAIARLLSDQPACADSTQELARRAGLGMRTMERRFLAETGLTLGAWRRQARLCHALLQLAAGESVKHVALESGYQSPSAFVSAFRAVFGTTPGQYFGDRVREATTIARAAYRAPSAGTPRAPDRRRLPGRHPP